MGLCLHFGLLEVEKKQKKNRLLAGFLRKGGTLIIRFEATFKILFYVIINFF